MHKLSLYVRLMKRGVTIAGLLFGFYLFSQLALPQTVSAETGDPCTVQQKDVKSNASFLGIPKWYKYLTQTGQGRIGENGKCLPQISVSENGESFNAADLLLVGLAVIEMLLYISGFIVVIVIIFSGFKYMTSQGNPESTKSAKGTIINAVIGIVIVTSATVLIRFIGARLQ